MIEFINQFSFSNYGFVLLLGMVIAWFVTQTSKAFFHYPKSLGELFWETGHGPSSHVAPLVALLAMILFNDGISAMFVLAIALTGIVIRDALGVRYATGKNAQLLKKLLKKDLQKDVVVIPGHAVKEVLLGAIFGLVVGLAFALLFL